MIVGINTFFHMAAPRKGNIFGEVSDPGRLWWLANMTCRGVDARFEDNSSAASAPSQELTLRS